MDRERAAVKVLDLFSGIGGFSLGLENAGFETVAFCEIDKKARAVLAKHWPNVKVFEDVTQLTKEKLDEHGISVDVICGGFPCQDLSVAGKGAGLEGARSGLWFEFHRLIKEIRPSWVIVENVSVLRSRGLDRVLRSLAEIGYDAEWHCIPASAVGAPHRRDRIWIVAYPNSSDKWARIGSEQSEGDTTGQRSADGGRLGAFGMVADTNSERLQRGAQAGNFAGIWQGIQQQLERRADGIGSTWAVEPSVGRVAHGVPGRVDRLKQLGNAVVPQIPELIGKAIMDAHYG